MANSWLRLWHDMPNDPKWRTIARVSKQPISAVLAVYIHLLVIASNATERGRTQNVCNEDIASALDLDSEQVDSILAAMQGRVLDGDLVSGWAKRQVEREDGAAERAKRWREAQKEAKQTQPNATERNRTPDTDTDTDTDTDKKNTSADKSADHVPEKQKTELPGFENFWKTWPTNDRKQAKGKCLDAWKKASAERDAALVLAHVSSLKNSAWMKDGGQYVPAPLVYLNQRRWEGADAEQSGASGVLAGAI